MAKTKPKIRQFEMNAPQKGKALIDVTRKTGSPSVSEAKQAARELENTAKLFASELQLNTQVAAAQIKADAKQKARDLQVNSKYELDTARKQSREAASNWCQNSRAVFWDGAVSTLENVQSRVRK
jgi:hypothetical protein